VPGRLLAFRRQQNDHPSRMVVSSDEPEPKELSNTGESSTLLSANDLLVHRFKRYVGHSTGIHGKH